MQAQAQLVVASAAAAIFTPPHPARPLERGGSAAAAEVDPSVWTPALAALSGYNLAEVAEAAAAVELAFGSGVVVAHNLGALAKEAAAKAAAARAGVEAAAVPKAYSHFQMEAVARKYAKPEVLEVSRLPVAVSCAAAPSACPAAVEAGGCCAAGLHLVLIGNMGLVPWALPPPQPAALFTPVAAAAGGGKAGQAGPAAVPTSAATLAGAASVEELETPPTSAQPPLPRAALQRARSSGADSHMSSATNISEAGLVPSL